MQKSKSQAEQRELQLRPMKTADIDKIVTLENECQLSSWGATGYQAELLNPSAVLLTAIVHDEVVGFFSGRMMADEFEIYTIAVAPKFRRQGLGAKILIAALEIAKMKGAKHAYLEVRAANEPAKKMYERHGFTLTGKRKEYYSAPLEDALLYSCEID